MLHDLTIMKTLFFSFRVDFFKVQETSKSYCFPSDRILSDSNNQLSDSIFVIADILSGSCKKDLYNSTIRPCM